MAAVADHNEVAVEYAVASAVDTDDDLHQVEPATAVTSVMASQIVAFDDSFTVK